MYKVVYYFKETVGKGILVQKAICEEFRLRRNALHYIREVVQSEYKENGYGTEQIAGGINCYKNEKTDEGDRKIIEVKIKVEKV